MIVDDILIQQRSQLNKFDIGCSIRQGGEGGIFKILEKKYEEKPRRYDHAEGSNKKEHGIQDTALLWHGVDNNKGMYML